MPALKETEPPLPLDRTSTKGLMSPIAPTEGELDIPVNAEPSIAGKAPDSLLELTVDSLASATVPVRFPAGIFVKLEPLPDTFVKEPVVADTVVAESVPLIVAPDPDVDTRVVPLCLKSTAPPEAAFIISTSELLTTLISLPFKKPVVPSEKTRKSSPAPKDTFAGAGPLSSGNTIPPVIVPPAFGSFAVI